MVVRRNLIGWSGQSFRQSSNLLQSPQILNTTQRDPTQQREPDPHSQRTERGSERGEGDLDELERGTGGQGWGWRLTDRGLGREEGEWGREIIGSR